MEFVTIFAIAFLLGIKHAVEPDHVIAVSTIASQSKKISRAAMTGVFWGIGHTATLFVVGLFLIMMKNEIPERWALSLEFTVGIMLVYLGISTFFAHRKKKIHVHEHEHNDKSHAHFHTHSNREQHQHLHPFPSYIKSALIGMVHGLAGSAAMVLLTMSTVESIWQGIVYILIFGAGTVLGMLLFTTIIGIPFVFSTGNLQLNQTLTKIVSLISIAFGFYYMSNLGFGEGLFRMWFS